MATIPKLESVLLVDDSESDNYLHRKLIEKAGIARYVHICESGQEALDFLNSKREGQYPQPELIFLDINMPGMNGWEFLEEYAGLEEGRKGGVVVVMLTTSLNPRDRDKAKAMGLVTDFLNKPLKQADLLAILESNFPKHDG